MRANDEQSRGSLTQPAHTKFVTRVLSRPRGNKQRQRGPGQLRRSAFAIFGLRRVLNVLCVRQPGQKCVRVCVYSMKTGHCVSEGAYLWQPARFFLLAPAPQQNNRLGVTRQSARKKECVRLSRPPVDALEFK